MWSRRSSRKRRRAPSKPKLLVADQLLFVRLYRLFPSVLNAATIVQPETIIRWHRAGCRLYWYWKSRSHGGRPKNPMKIRCLIQEMSLANRLGSVPRIHGEPLRLEIEVLQLTIAKYMVRRGWVVTGLQDVPKEPRQPHLRIVPLISPSMAGASRLLDNRRQLDLP